MKDFSYSKNTLFLIIAGIFSQIFGAVLKILLSYRLKEEGMAIYHIALTVYSVFLTPVLCGMPIAVTQFISKCKGTEKSADMEHGINFSFTVMCILGIICSILMLISRRFFAISLKESSAEYAILLLCPSVLFVALGAFAKSFFEGHSNMLPCSVSQCIESILKLIFAYVFTYIMGIFSLKYAAAGATLAITAGEAFATLILFAFMIPNLKRIRLCFKKTSLCREIIAYALPITFYAVILNSLNLLENSVIRNALLAVRFDGASMQKFLLRYSSFTSAFDSIKETGRLSARGADWLYGAYFGYALTIVRFPLGLLRTFCVPFFPLATKYFANNNMEGLGISLSKLTRLMFTLSVPLCAFFIAFAPQITKLVFGSSAYSVMLVFISPILIISPVSELFITVCYADGKTFPPFIFSFITSFLSITLSAFLIRIPHLNILGTAVASVSAAFLELFLLYRFTKRCILIKASASYRS